VPAIFLSEPWVTSDNIKPHRSHFVRTWGHFGQYEAAQVTLCPNLGALRTIRSHTAELLSELGGTSDNTKPHRPHFVRTWRHFGQNQALPPSFCPNLEALQTIRSRTAELLSELGGTSDNTKPHRPHFVRTWRHFRQYEAAQVTLCPNLGALRTIRSRTGHTLSELGGTSDNTKPHRPHFVRTWRHFGQYEAPQATLCPNLASLQTIRSRTGHTLSELGGTSDNTKPHRPHFVRTWRHFGQNKVTRASFCPNMGKKKKESLFSSLHPFISRYSFGEIPSASRNTRANCLGFL
jgi:hypothetical protein